MAKSGTILFTKSNNTSNGSYIIGKIEWSSIPNESTNKSTVTVKLYCKKGNDSMQLTTATEGTWNWTLNIFGRPTSGYTSSGTKILTDWVKLTEMTLTLSHNDAGTLSGTLGGSVTAPTGTMYAGLTTSGSQAVSLDPIASASGISSVFADYIGNNCEVKWVPASTSFRYVLEFSLGNWSYTTPYIAPGTTSTYTYTYALPYEIAEQLKNTLVGTLTVTLKSYVSAADSTPMGTDSKSTTVYVPSNEETRPVLTSAPILTPINTSVPSALSSLYIRGKSRVNVVLAAEGRYGADIARYVLQVGSAEAVSSTSNSILSGVLSTSGTVSVFGSIIDTRGLETPFETSIKVLSYSKPSIVPATGEKIIYCKRCDAAGNENENGTCLRIKAGRIYSRLTQNGQNNFCTLRYRYKKASEASYSNWITLLSADYTYTDTADTVISNVQFARNTSYSVQLGVVDTMGESKEWTATIYGKSDEVPFHIRKDGKGVGIGERCQESNSFSINPDWDVYGQLWGLGKCKIAISANDDLNNYKRPGTYSVPTAAVAASLYHCPSSEAGVLVVSSAVGDGATIDVLQRYIPRTGEYEYVRHLISSSASAWKARGETEWADLGFSTYVATSGTDCGRLGSRCAYRVVNANHVYVAFNCAFPFSGEMVPVNSSPLPAQYRPPRDVYAMCATNGRAIARVVARPDGNIYVDFVQSMASAEETTSASVYWIDGYIDYWF